MMLRPVALDLKLHKTGTLQISTCCVIAPVVVVLGLGHGRIPAHYDKRPEMYSIRILESASESNASAINDKCAVVGQFISSPSTSGYCFSRGRFNALPSPRDFSSSRANAISQSGLIVGALFNEAESGHVPIAVIWDALKAKKLSEIQFTEAFAVTDKDGICGVANGRPALWRNGKFDYLTDANHPGTARGMNVRGAIVGELKTVAGTHAFLWRRGKLSEIGTLGGKTSSASAINFGGQIIGWSETADGAIHGFLYSDGRMKDLGTLDGFKSYLAAINDHGTIVGYALDNRARSRAIVVTKGRITALESLSKMPGDTVLETAVGINNRGWIVGTAIRKGKLCSYLAIPRPL